MSDGIVRRYYDDPRQQHCYTLYVLERKRIDEVSVYSGVPRKAIRRWIEDESWDKHRADLAAGSAKKVREQLEHFAVTRQLPMFSSYYRMQGRLLEAIEDRLNHTEELSVKDLATVSRALKDAYAVGLGVVKKDTLDVDSQDAEGIAIQVNVLNGIKSSIDDVGIVNSKPLDDGSTSIEIKSSVINSRSRSASASTLMDEEFDD